MTETRPETSANQGTSSLGTSSQGTPNEGLVRAIGRWSVAALTVNCIIGSGVFGLPSVLAAKLGKASVLAVLLGGVAAGVVMACFAEVSSRFHETGGPYLYAREAFGRFMGIQVAWLLWFVRLASCAANANLFVVYLGEFFPRSSQTIPKLVILTLLIGILAAINVRGVRAGTWLSNSFTGAKLASLGLVALAGLFYLIATHRVIPQANISPASSDWAGAMVLLIFAYGGFETALISAGEARNPRRDMPFGLFAALITCAILYSLIQWVVVGVLPDPGHSERPLADVARIVMVQGMMGQGLGHAGAAVIAVGALISIYGYLSGNILSTPRVTFALAERGDFPSLFALVHPRFRTPYVSIFVFALLVWLLAVLGSFAGNATLSAGSRLFYYGLVCAALPALRRKQKTPGVVQIPGGIFLAVAGVLICVGLVTRIEYTKSWILAVAVAVAFTNWLAVRKSQS
ncbi:MAG TPA: APC family permease [Candidatus Sulfotelmatobacter sp.]|nr:APC family permease [Candidatus Sulfotelmatobacter sp.]